LDAQSRILICHRRNLAGFRLWLLRQNLRQLRANFFCDHLSDLAVLGNPTLRGIGYSASAKRTSDLSHQFRKTLADAGLIEPRTHESTNKGHSAAREPSEISFHSLRHSAVTMLKAAGVSDFMAREIVGHESAAVSRQYTHLTTNDKRAAMQRLPDVTDA
jgi:integrase